MGAGTKWTLGILAGYLGVGVVLKLTAFQQVNTVPMVVAWPVIVALTR
ncbi:MAG: hypothetical protein JWL95_3244 [Gemmatimonadetes bacterium]|nr:hypothetical protein [Gemmatimonadota bacterium]